MRDECEKNSGIAVLQHSLLEQAMTGRQRYAERSVFSENAFVKRAVEIQCNRLAGWEDRRRQPTTREFPRDPKTCAIAELRSADRLGARIEPAGAKCLRERFEVDDVDTGQGTAENVVAVALEAATRAR